MVGRDGFSVAGDRQAIRPPKVVGQKGGVTPADRQLAFVGRRNDDSFKIQTPRFKQAQYLQPIKGFAIKSHRALRSKLLEKPPQRRKRNLPFR